jgi:hypothetical protein
MVERATAVVQSDNATEPYLHGDGEGGEAARVRNRHVRAALQQAPHLSWAAGTGSSWPI